MTKIPHIYMQLSKNKNKWGNTCLNSKSLFKIMLGSISQKHMSVRLKESRFLPHTQVGYLLLDEGELKHHI